MVSVGPSLGPTVPLLTTLPLMVLAPPLPATAFSTPEFVNVIPSATLTAPLLVIVLPGARSVPVLTLSVPLLTNRPVNVRAPPLPASVCIVPELVKVTPDAVVTLVVLPEQLEVAVISMVP